MMNKSNDIISVVLIRHAQSEWNRDNRFTDWTDPPHKDLIKIHVLFPVLESFEDRKGICHRKDANYFIDPN